MIMIVKTPGSQMGSPAAAEEGGEEVGGGRWESRERSEVQARSTLTSTAPKARSMYYHTFHKYLEFSFATQCQQNQGHRTFLRYYL